MSYVARYEWTGENNQTVRIYRENWGGGITTIEDLSAESGGPWTHEIGQRGHDIDEPLSEHVVKLYVVAPQKNFLSIIETGTETEFLLEILSGATLQYRGLVETSLGERLDSDSRHVVIVTAKSGLDYLENVAFTGSGRLSLFDAIKTCLDELPYNPILFHTIDRWHAFNVAGDPLKEHFIDVDIFEGRDCKYVLEQVLGRKGLNLRQSLGRWHIQQPDALYEGLTKRYSYDADGNLTGSTSSYSPEKVYDGTDFKAPDPTVFKRTAYGAVEINYRHGTLGGDLIPNGDFSRGDLGNQNPTGWSRSAPSKSRWASQELEIDAWYKDEPHSGDPPELLWSVSRTGGVVASSNPRGVLKFDAYWQINPDPLTTARSEHPTRKLPFEFKAGNKWFDRTSESWSETQIINYVEVSPNDPQEFGFNLPQWVETAEVFIKFYGIIDDRAVDISVPKDIFGVPDGSSRAGWRYDVLNVRIDNVKVELVEEGEEEPSETITTTVLTIPTNRKIKSYSFDVGEGPTGVHRARMTDSGGNQLADWQFGDNFGSASGVPLDEFHGKRAMGMLRTPRASKHYSFHGDAAFLRGHQVLEDGGRFWPVYYRSTPYLRKFGGEFVRIRRDGETGLSIGTEETRRPVGFVSGGRAEIFKQFSNLIINTSFAMQVATTSDVVRAQFHSGIPINPITMEAGKAGVRVVLFDPDTAEKHVLTLTRPILSGQGVMNIERYDFPKAIRRGAPIFLYPEDVLASFVHLENIAGFLMEQGRLTVIDGDQRGNLTSITVEPISLDVKDGDSLEIVNLPGDGGTFSAQVNGEHDQGDTSIAIHEAWIDVKDGASVFNSSRQASAELLVSPDRIVQTTTLEREGYVFTVLSANHSGTITSLNVAPTPTAVKANDVFKVSHLLYGVTFDAILASDVGQGATNLPIQSVDLSNLPTPIPSWMMPQGVVFFPGSPVRLADQTTRGELIVQAGLISANASNITGNTSSISSLELRADTLEATVVLKAEVTAGEITKIASVQLDSSVAGGSAITLAADLIRIAGTMQSADALDSDNFITGSAGWQIKGDGDAEFNDVTIRGTVTNSTQDYTIDEEGIELNLALDAASMIRWGALATSTPRVAAFNDPSLGNFLQLGGDGTDLASAKIFMVNIPTTDPNEAGQLWNDNGTLKISAG